MYEVELRSFLTKEKYEELLLFFHKHAQFINEDEQTTYYFNAPVDLRLQQNTHHARLIVKKGSMHDDAREEIEIPFARDDFSRMHDILNLSGFSLQVKWLRKRFLFRWEEIVVTLDDTKGYGFILELEKQCGTEEKERVLALLQEKLIVLDVALTPKQEFEQKFADYNKNWKFLLGHL